MAYYLYHLNKQGQGLFFINNDGAAMNQWRDDLGNSPSRFDPEPFKIIPFKGPVFPYLVTGISPVVPK